jgi:hypothetical protein
MYHQAKKVFGLTIVALMLLALPALTLPGHAQEEAEAVVVPIIRTETSRHCAALPDGVVDEESYRKLAATEQCVALKKLDVDFHTQTLIYVTVHGDCFVWGTVELSRDDRAMKYTCKIRRVFGGCRAAGRLERWAVVEKLRPEYKLEFLTTTYKRGEAEPQQ